MYHHRQCMQLMHARLVSHQHAADRSRQYPKIQKTPIELGSKCMWGALRGSRLLSATLAPAQQHAIRRTAHQLPLFLFHPFTCLCRAYAPASTHGVSTCHRNGSSRRCVTLIAGRGCRPAGKGEQPLLFVQNNLGRGAGGDAHATSTDPNKWNEEGRPGGRPGRPVKEEHALQFTLPCPPLRPCLMCPLSRYLAAGPQGPTSGPNRPARAVKVCSPYPRYSF